MSLAASASGLPEGPWNPGIQSQIPSNLRYLSTIVRPENVATTFAAAIELQQLTGLQLAEIVCFRPQRLLLHELMIRVMADLSVPDGSRIEDLGINFREMTSRILARHIAPNMGAITAAYDREKSRLRELIQAAFSQHQPVGDGAIPEDGAGAMAAVPTRKGRGFLARFSRRRDRQMRARREPLQAEISRPWDAQRITACEHLASTARDPVEVLAYRALGRVLAALFATHGRSWGTSEMIVSLATDIAANTHCSAVIGRMIEPMLTEAAQREGYSLLPRQDLPVVINTKGPSASGKSTLRPLQKKLAGKIGVSWTDFALISPDIWRKQLLDYGTLGTAYRYAGAFTSEELQLVDQKLDLYMAVKHQRGDMAHLLIDRFRFDSFAPDSDEAGSNLLTRFGHSVYLFFMITPPQSLVERAWKRGLEVGRFKAVDDTLAHSVEAYAGMPDVFFTWVKRSDKRIHFEFLDNSVSFGEAPRTVAFGTNSTLNILQVKGIIDIERYGRVNVDATGPETLYADPGLLAPEQNVAFLRRCVRGFELVNFADPDTGRIYLRVHRGRVSVDRDLLQRALSEPCTQAGIRSVIPAALECDTAITEGRYLSDANGTGVSSTVGQWSHVS